MRAVFCIILACLVAWTAALAAGPIVSEITGKTFDAQALHLTFSSSSFCYSIYYIIL